MMDMGSSVQRRAPKDLEKKAIKGAEPTEKGRCEA